MEQEQKYIDLWSIAASEDYYKTRWESGYARRLYNFFAYAEIGDELVFFSDKEEAARGFCVYGYLRNCSSWKVLNNERVFVTAGILSVKRVEDMYYGVTLEATTVEGMKYYICQYQAYDLRRKAGFPLMRQD